MADRPLSIDIRHPLILKANDLVLLTRQDGDIPLTVPGFGLFYRDPCYLAEYIFRLHGTTPLLLMASDSEGVAAAMNLTNSRLSTLNGQTVEDHKLSLRRSFLVLDQRSQAGTSQAGTSKVEAPAFIDTTPIRNFSSARVILEIGSRLKIIQTDASDGSVPAA